MIKTSIPIPLPEVGSVGGIDVGWSEKRASSAVARISWNATSIDVNVKRFRAIESERSATILEVLSGGALCVAIDGPLLTGFADGSTYRFAERVLTLGFQPYIGKPGQTSSYNGRLLNWHATRCAMLLANARLVERAEHEEKIHSLAIVEAFPTSFLGVLLRDPNGLKNKRKASSDIFYGVLAETGTLEELVCSLLPARQLKFSFDEFRNHDDRAAIVCAITALCVAAGEYTAVGDDDGWIILPPFRCIQPWAHERFKQNAGKLKAEGIVPKSSAIKLGLLAGMYPELSLEEFNALDDEITEHFLNGSIFPEVT